MNKQELLDIIRQTINTYGFDSFFSEKFLNDFNQILLKDASGKEVKILSLLIKQLQFVHDLGVDVDKADSNERLKNVTECTLYSLHIKNKTVNIRILITFHGFKAVFLHAFNEKSGKKKTSYSTAIPKAIERYKDYLEMEGDVDD